MDLCTMSEIVTNFPPQTYSSSFFLNSLTDDEKNTVGCSMEGPKRTDTPLLDCFLSTLLSGQKRSSKSTESALNDSKNGEKEVTDIWDKKIIHHSSRPFFRSWKKSAALGKFLGERAALKAASKQGEKSEDDKSLKLLAITALDLSAPASDVLLKSRSSSWFQLSGHPDSLAPAGPGTVWKKRACGSDDTERLVYEELSQDPLLCDIIPKYYREVDYQGEKFIELQDLLHGFQDPYVVDVKMGTRTFLEAEVKKSAARGDLYQKMVAIDPDAPTKEEHLQKAVTKLRYMQFRELQSSTCSHGFRIEAMKCRGSPPMTDLKTVKSNEEVFKTLDLFLGGREDVRQRLLKRLCEIRHRIEQSEYFKYREVVGSSLFVIYDDTKVGVWLIDFAKTNKLPDGLTLDHRTQWQQGNHEEGLLFGLDRLISVFENLRMPSTDKRKGPFSLPTVSVKS